MSDATSTIPALLANASTSVRDTYARLLEEVQALGPFRQEPKKTSIHLAHTVGFAGIHPRKQYLYLNLRTDAPISSPRIHKSEQVSRNRYHNEIKLTTPDEVDPELVGWLRAAYALG